MRKLDLRRLIRLEDRTRVIAEEFGLMTTEILFEVVPAQRVLEGLAYHFPTNFSHWSFGRDYEKYRTIYEHTGSGIPYEQVWNFEVPRAFLVETNPFALNVMVVAHVYGHVDFFLGNRFLKRGREIADIAGEARNAARRFELYEQKYGKAEVERIIDAAMSIRWHEDPDPFFEEPEEEELRQGLMELEREKLMRGNDVKSEFQKPITPEEEEKIEKRLSDLAQRTPPQPTHDILLYIMRRSPKPLKPWMIDVLGVVRRQARALSPNRRTKMLDEGWATYWHVRIMRRLFEEGLLSSEEHGVFNDFHAGVTQESKLGFNWYRVGLALFENVKERWDKGQFGRDFEECEDPQKHADWDNKAGLGSRKIFDVRSFYSDRMAVEELFADQFIAEQDLYIYREMPNPNTGMIDYVIVEDDPEKIRRQLKWMMTLYGVPVVLVQNGNYDDERELMLVHQPSGFELDPNYRNLTLRNIYHLWGREVHLETISDDDRVLFSFDGSRFFERRLK